MSHRIGLIYHAIPRVIQSETGSLGLDNIKQYIYRNVHRYGNIRDDGPGWMLIYGEAWCDSVANIYIRLAEALDIRGYLIFLGNGSHSVAYVTPGHTALENIDYLQENAIVVDLEAGIIYKCKPRDICGVDKRYCKKPAIFLINQPISEYRPFKTWFYKKVFPRIPVTWLKKYIQIALICRRFERGEREYYLARVHQLFFDYDAAARGYQGVIKRHPATRWADLAGYWAEQISLRSDQS